MRGLVSIIFLIHLVITQGDNSDKTRKLDQMSIKIKSSRNITQTRQPYTPKSDFKLICRLKLKAQEILQTCQLYRPRRRSPTSNSNECFCVRLRIDQMSIKIQSSRNITNVSAIDPKVRLQMATSVCVFDFKLIKCRL